jgi:hypothetical protein
MKATQTKTTQAKQTKAAKRTPAPAPEKQANRYLRTSRVIIKEGAGIDPVQLGVMAAMSTATANHCLSAWEGICTAMREVGMLPVKKAPKKAVSAPTARVNAPEPADAA